MSRVYNALIAIHSLYIVLVILFSVHAFSSPTALLYSLATAPNNWTISQRSIGYQDDLTKFYRIIYQTNPTGLGASFAAGFYCVNSCTTYLFSVFIFEADGTGGIVTLSPTKVVWSANRSNPVSENATLLLTSNSGLCLSLHDSDGALVWYFGLLIGEEKQEQDYIVEVPGMPSRFSLQELEVATQNFGKKLREGGFGTVFEGSLGDEKVAVKRLEGVERAKKEFLAEVQIIGNIHHINLVRLIGFCAEKSKRLLVYEYMYNGSLDKWIYGEDGRTRLNWGTRYSIIIDIAKGLCYLHEDCRQRIVHLDIKPENILLDENFNAKVADFGLCKLIDRDKIKVMTQMRGTPGYLAPEWLTAVITEKVDVYSFGVVVMEILCGRRNLDYSQTEENRHLITLLEVKSKCNELCDLIDKSVEDFEVHKEEIMHVMELAMWCLQTDCTRRPSMSVVVKVLEGAMEVETSLDYYFASSIPMIAAADIDVDQSIPLVASVLSGPR
ncbi:hypothetical protein LUZ63_009147 [Rhynchospora breviuscula]|uniref:non-specific serine/threonine protein kinase n=1 Tax=Rhynchospora breviuscula TaxID=2022672 RepID=A0A9Q0CFA3_9POAL|nr:hypothetical protein LUZ63_009147 [Rhynchospora breviuscula]